MIGLGRNESQVVSILGLELGVPGSIPDSGENFILCSTLVGSGPGH